LPDVCYRSNGDGTFRDVSAEVGVNPTGKGLGVLAADINLDGHIDIYVANDTTDNFLYLNDGHGKFEEVGLMSGVALDDRGVANGSMGIDLCDYNQDGLPDIWVANYERETFALYRNEGRGQFLHASKLTGITALGQLVVGFGTACMDLDRDADEDIVVACGHMLMYPTTTPRDQIGLMLENHNHHFKRVSYPEGHYFATPHQAKGLIAADLDNDGDVDLAVAHTNAPAALLRNDVTQGSWLAAQLVGTHSNRNGIGAWLVLRTSAGDMLRLIKGGGSFMSGHPFRAFWGFGENTAIKELEIHWPSGQRTLVSAPAADQLLTIIEPAPD
jgi:hypothetical protein